jgi:transcriptional regulator with GAF, ATPase, and Fis domain
VDGVSVPAGLSAQLAAASRALEDEPDTQHTLQRSVRIATELLASCDYAGVSIVNRNGSIDTPAATDILVERADQLQYEFGEGPCLDAIWHHDTVTSEDLTEEARWPRWAPRVAADFGVRSMLCLQLFTGASVVGALNLYSESVAAFTPDDFDTATYLAAHVAVAVAGTQHADDLRLGALNRTIIGQAQGILMERFSVDAAGAFTILRRVSQDSSKRLLWVAGELVHTRVTPGDETADYN